MGRKSKKQLTLEMIETQDFNSIDWVQYKNEVVDLKDTIELLYGKRFYKRIINKIEGKRSFWDKLLRR